MVERRVAYRVWGGRGNLREEDHLETQAWMDLQEVGCWGME
jgi:hypothetical protein